VGLIRTDIDLLNPRSGELAPLKVTALVDTGAITLCIPEHVAVQLDLAELEKREDAPKEELEKRFKELTDLTDKIERLQKLEAIKPAKNPLHDMKKEDRARWSFGRAIQCLMTGRLNGVEREISDELAKRYPIENRGIIIPEEELLRFKKLETRAPIKGESALVDDPLKPELLKFALRERSIVDRLGVTRISADGSFNWPSLATSTAAFIKGDGTDSIAESNPTPTTSQSAEPHFLTTLTSYSAQQTRQMSSNLSLSELLRRNMMMGMEETLSNKLLNATSATSGEPDGIVKLVGTQGEVAKSLSSTVKWKWTDWTGIMKTLKVNYKSNDMDLKVIMNPVVEQELEDVQKFSGTDGESIFDSLDDRQNIIVTNQLVDTRVIIGDFKNIGFVTFGGGIMLEAGRIDDDFEKLIDRIRAVLACDFAMIGFKEAFASFKITRA